MATVNTLHTRIPDNDEALMRADGFALWAAWPGEVNPVASQALEDYGGIAVADGEGQSLWFFFSFDALLAAARLSVWSRFNALVMELLIFPARLIAAENGDKGLEFDEAVRDIQLNPQSAFRIWTHASLAQAVESTPGLSLEKDAPADAPGPDWSGLEVDPRLPYQSRQGWHALIRPAGNPLDKEFQAGWREFFPELEAVLQRGKFRFIIHNFYVMFPVDTLRRLKTWCREFLSLVARMKAEHPERYWPCLFAVVERKGLNLNEELPQKSGVPWERLAPDYPHMAMRAAFMLGEGFGVHKARFGAFRSSPDDWASVSLLTEDAELGTSVPQIVAPHLILGPEPPCFYCGQTSHKPAACPSKQLAPQEAGIWSELAELVPSALLAASTTVESRLAPLEGEARAAWVQKEMREKSPEGTLLRALYDIGWPAQARSIAFFWRIRNNDVANAAGDLAPRDNSPIWTMLDDFGTRDNTELDKELKNLGVKYPQEFRVPSLRGFLAMERGDLAKAEGYWKEADRLSPRPSVQGWHGFLLARLLECRGKTGQAAEQFEQLTRVFPNWQEVRYRKEVCRIKSGFGETALAALTPLMEKNGHLFNRAMIDPELERGYIQVRACLARLWTLMEKRAKDELANLDRMRVELGAWFVPDNPFAAAAEARLEQLRQVGALENFVAFQRLCTGRARLEKDMQNRVLDESRGFKTLFRNFMSRLKVVKEESAWFPFPSALVEFNRRYNKSVANVNWALTANFHSPESFRKAQVLAREETERIARLEGRLKFLRIIRDSTLFVLSMTESFFWLEIVGLLFIFVFLPLLLLYGDKLGLDMASGALLNDRWQVQKALFFAITVIAAGVAVLRTVLRFERIREKILSKARAKAEAAVKAARSAGKGKKILKKTR